MAYTNSYEFQNEIRDLSGAFDQLVQAYPTLLSLVRVGPAVANNKFEWLEEQLTPTTATIASFDTDGDGTGVNVGDTTGFKAGDIIVAETSAGASRTEVMKIASVDSATDLTIVRDYGSSTGATLATGDVLKLVSRPLAEGTDATAGDGAEAGTAHNFTQIEDEVAKISRTTQQARHYGVENMLNDQVQRKMVSIMRRINNSLIWGYKVERSSSNNGTTGGLLQFLSSGNVNAVSGALTAGEINESLAAIFSDGGYSNNYALVCAENQARKISAFNTSGSNPVVQRQATDRSTGGYISTFVGDLPVQNGFTANVVVDPNFPKDQLAIVDMNRVSIRYMQTLTDRDATPAGADYFQRRLLTEFGFEIRDGGKAHALLTGLTV